MCRLISLVLILALFSSIAHGGFGGFLQANTAVDVIVGPFIDDTDGKTAETLLTITQAEVRLSKNGANTAQKTEATSLTHDELGNYVCKLDATDTNTEGILTLMIHESGALAVKVEYQVLAQAAYISLMTAKDTGYMGVDVEEVDGTDQTGNDNGADINTIVTAVGNIETDTAAYDTDGEYATAIWNALTNAYGGAGTYGQAVEDILVDTGTTLDDLIDTEIGTIVTAVGNIETDTAAMDTAGEWDTLMATVLGYTDDIGVAGAGLTAIDLPNQTMDVSGTWTGNITGNLSGTIGSNLDLDSTAEFDTYNATVVTAVGNIETDTGTTIPATITTAQADLNTITGASGVLIDTDAVDADAIKADAVTEIWSILMIDLDAGAPAYNATANVALNWIFEAWRNQTWSTSTEITIYKDDASTPLVESTISDDSTTFKRQEMRAPD